ncbi:MAG: CYTH domain-containing protein [Bacteroidales bacterium]|nr:CYTH domain-containing protein [Bacteroidales bacterium]MBQ9186181.1 CYTH domain-containing protein [Bacteroidales bacterium]
MNLETERKFLVKDDSYKKEAVKSYEISQGYIAREEGNTVRVRLRDGVGFLTIKGRTTENGLSRPEWEMEIPADDARELMALCKRGRIQKIRHIIPAGDGLKWEVDEFLGDNTGLVMAEIELPSPETPFSRPAWLSTEVTGAKEFYNSYLSAHPFSTWGK